MSNYLEDLFINEAKTALGSKNCSGSGGSNEDQKLIDAVVGKSVTKLSCDSETIADHAFYKCKTLTTAYFPKATSIGKYAFGYCENLTTVVFTSAATIGKHSFFNCKKLETAVFPVATTIDESAFNECRSLTSINFPAVTSIGESAFSNCISLTSVNLPEVSEIDDYAFSGCLSLKTITLPEACFINYYALYDCSSLTLADFPKAISIGQNSLSGTTKLKALILRNTNGVCVLGGSGIPNSAIESGKGYIYVPSALIEQYKAASKWSQYASQFRALEDYTVDGTISGALDEEACEAINNQDKTITENGIYTADEGYDGLGTVTVEVPNSAGGQEVLDAMIGKSITEISSNATKIGVYTFYKCTSLTSTNFPVATSIGGSAFSGCTSLTSTNFPAMMYIGNYAFSSCKSLTSINFPVATSIGISAFLNCSNLVALSIRNTAQVCVLSKSNALSSTTIESGSGYIYVPSALIEQYKVATNWSTYATQFRALEDYTVDGTVTGELDETKI